MQRPLKPRVLGDVAPSGRARARRWNAFEALPQRLNFIGAGRRRTIHFPFARTSKIFIAAIGGLYLALGSVAAPIFLPNAAGDTATSTSTAAEQAALQGELQQLEGQINQYEGQVSSYESQGNTLQGEIDMLNAKIARLNLQIKATRLTMQELDQEITSTQSEITSTQSDIANKESAIGGLMQAIYQNDHLNLMEIFLRDPRLSDFWSDSQDVLLLQDNLRIAVQQVTDLQGQLTDQEHQFEASKADASSAAQYQAAQAAEVAGTKNEKAQLLAATRGQESRYLVLLQKTKETAAQVRSHIFQLLGGGQLSFGDAYQYAKLASGATGIDPAFILAVLDRESALGQNVGQCSYRTAMNPLDIPLFLNLTASLKLDPNTMMVSCPNADGAYGGAMGPAQFIPSTWNLYANEVSTVTGDSPASPWNNADAFVATALYLNDAMAGCKAIYGNAISQERCTAAKYYAGSRWRNYLWTYGEAVVERAQSFAGDIKTITS